MSFHRNRSLWAVITNKAFLILNHVNNHHVFIHRNRSLWAVVTNLALLIFAEVLYYHMNRVFIQKSHKPDKTRLYLKMGATYRLPWYTLDLSQWRLQQCSQCSLCFVFSVLHGQQGPGARQPDLQVIMTTDQSTISQSTKTSNSYRWQVNANMWHTTWYLYFFLSHFYSAHMF